MPQLRYVLFSFANYKSKCQPLSNDVWVKQKRQGKPKGYKRHIPMTNKAKTLNTENLKEEPTRGYLQKPFRTNKIRVLNYSFVYK